MCDQDPRREPLSLQPPPAWEYLIDAVLLIGAGFLLWFALHVAGLLSAPPEYLFKPWHPKDPAGDAIFVYVLALVGISEYFALQYMLNDKLRARRGEPPWPARLRIVMRIAFAAAVWIYILVINLIF